MTTATAIASPAPAPAGRRLLTKQQVKDVLQIGDSKYHELVASGRLKSVKLDRCRRVLSDSLEAFIENLTGE